MFQTQKEGDIEKFAFSEFSNNEEIPFPIQELDFDLATGATLTVKNGAP